MAPAKIRGRLGSFYQWMYTLGIFIAYWCDLSLSWTRHDIQADMMQDQLRHGKRRQPIGTKAMADPGRTPNDIGQLPTGWDDLLS